MSIDNSKLFKSILHIEVQRCFPQQTKGRPSKITYDEAYDDILHVIRTGMQWRHLRPKTVSFITIFKTMHRWVKADVFRTAYRNMLRLYQRKRRPRYYCIDSSFIKNMYGVNCTGRNPTDRGRQATKVSTVVDDYGVPYGALYTPANVSDMRLFEPTISALLVPLQSKTEMYADKGYDSKANRNACLSFGLKDRLFKRKTTNGRKTHAKRGVIERFFSWIDKYRRLILRFEKYVSVYEAMSYFVFGIIVQTRLGGSCISV